MSAHTALTIAAALVAWTLVSPLVALFLCRIAHILSINPRVSESDQECAAHCHAELDGAGLPLGLVGHFHTIHEEASK